MSRRAKVASIACIVCACLVFLTTAVKLAGVAFGRQPFRMTVRPIDGHSVVQFAQLDRGLSSPEFPADLVIEQDLTIELRSGEVSAPGCRVEFFDTTLLPGRFRLWVGRTYFDVMERGIIVDGREHDWRP